MRSGFRVVDCPPLTAQGKTSADIHIVLDALDALAYGTRHDEFIIASADADFAPLIYRLRAHDRLTTVVTAGPASAAYRSMCDSVILPEAFADAVLGAETESAAVTDASLVPAPGPPVTARAPSDPVDAAAAAEAVRAAVRSSSRPVVSATAAHAARAAYPEIRADGWAGTGSFRAFITRHVPDLVWAGPSPGYVYDPSRHTAADLPEPAEDQVADVLGPVPAQVCRVTGTPHLTPEQYAVLFEELADEVATNGFARTETSRAVRDRTIQRGLGVSRSAVNFVVQGLIYSGREVNRDATPRKLATAFATNVRTLCRNAQMELGDVDVTAIDRWLTGPSPE